MILQQPEVGQAIGTMTFYKVKSLERNRGFSLQTVSLSDPLLIYLRVGKILP